MPSAESITIRNSIHKETGASNAPLSEQRRAWIDYAATQSLHPDVELREERISGIPCLRLTRSFSPKDIIILYIHGGGLVDGCIATHREFVSRLVAITGYKAIIVEYRLAPEYPFPAALDDILSVYDELTSSRQINEKHIVLGGDSSGGGLALSALAKLVKEQKSLPLCAFTISGVFDMTLSGESMKSRNDIDPCLSHEALKTWTLYFNNIDLADESISPLFGSLKNMPPILLQVGDHEVWLDDSRRIKEKIDAANGEAELRVWDAMWHVSPMYSTLPEASEAIKEIGAFIDRILTSTASTE